MKKEVYILQDELNGGTDVFKLTQEQADVFRWLVMYTDYFQDADFGKAEDFAEEIDFSSLRKND